MRNAVDFDPVFAGELLVGDGHPYTLAEYLGAAAG